MPDTAAGNSQKVESAETIDIELTPLERNMAAGKCGDATEWAVESQIRVASFFGARRLIPVTHAHIVANFEVMGVAGTDLVRRFAAKGARFRVPTSTNAQFCTAVRALTEDQDGVIRQRAIDIDLKKLGAATIDTCIPYQSSYQPHVGEAVAWGDTGAVCYANSVFGAHSNFEAGAASLAAALTGRVPEYGMHLPEARQGTILVEVTCDLGDYADWGALGAHVGRNYGDYSQVPVFKGLPSRVRSDDLKHLAAALASYGSIPMFGIEGRTPDALTISAAFGGRAPARQVTVTGLDRDAIFASWQSDRQQADLVVFSGPQQSLNELQMLAELLEGKRVKDGTQMIVTTSLSMWAMASRMGYVQTIEQAGGVVLQGVCFYLMELEALHRKYGWRTIVTNSAKLANIVGAYDYEPVLLRTRDCIDVALAGRITGEPRQ